MIMTSEEVARYHRDGYVLVNNLFNRDEINKMIREVEGGERVAGTTLSNDDRSGLKAKLAIWFELGSDIWSAVSTCPRLVNNVSALLGEDTAFFHGKVMLKEARSGGAWGVASRLWLLV